jgi:hypothetical protein
MTPDGDSRYLTRIGRRGKLERQGRVGMRRTALFSLNLTRRHKHKGGEDSGQHSRWAQTPRRTCNQEAEDVTVQSPRQHKTQQ